MDVHCPQCDTLFEFDERQMRGAIATLKCSVCQHLFRIETNISLGREDHRRWMIRHVNTGDVLYFSGFDMLHRWIMEGQVQRGDEISRTGNSWRRLEDIGEFTPVFEVVDSIQNLTKQSMPAGAVPRQETIQQFAVPQPSRSPSRQPAPSWVGAPTAPQGLSLSPLAGPAARELPPSPAPLATAPMRTRTPQRVTAQPLVDPYASTDQEPRQAPSSTQLAAAQQPVAQQSVQANVKISPKLEQAAVPADTWTMHSPAEPELYRVEPVQQDNSTSGGPLKVIVALLILAVIGVVAFRFAAPDKFMQVTGMSIASAPEPVETPDVQPAIDEKELDSPKEVDSLATASLGVHAAHDEAIKARDARVAAQIDASIIAAKAPVYAAAEQSLDKASRAGKRSSTAGMLKSARSARESGDTERASTLYRKVLDRDSRNAKAFTGLGWTLIQMGNNGSAAIQFKRAISSDSSMASAYLGLAKAERNKGNARGAIRIYEEFLKKFPAARESHIARAQRDKLLKEIGQ